MTRVTGVAGLVAGICGILSGCFLPKGPPCNQYWDQSSPGVVRIVVENQTAGPLFFPTGCGQEPQPTLTRADGTTVAMAQEHEPAGAPGECGFTCQDKQTNPTVCMFAAAPCQSGFLRINPGASVSVNWERLEFRNRDMPDMCWASNTEQSCSQVMRSDEGAYTVSAQGFTTCEATSAARCECAAGQDNCMLDPSAHQTESATPVTATATFNVPADGEARVVFR